MQRVCVPPRRCHVAASTLYRCERLPTSAEIDRQDMYQAERARHSAATAAAAGIKASEEVAMAACLPMSPCRPALRPEGRYVRFVIRPRCLV